ncbi:MAG TPA: HNH endonuclease [Armatimonadota bacterium]|nr:HNH endonuclease [Armatimonadota bacterium]
MARRKRIARKIRDKLLADSMRRCCLCPEHADITEIHYIIPVREDGRNTEDDLLIVCHNCHGKIEQIRGRYTPDQLLEYKRRWAGLCRREDLTLEQKIREAPAIQDMATGPLLPPLPYFAHPYPLQKHFTGRVAYRKRLTDWLTAADCPIFSLTAIGGAGKSALAWAWVQRDVLGRTLADAAADSTEDADACRLPADSQPEGILWWSFYERESAFSSFLDEALTYTSDGQVNPADVPSDYDKAKKLLQLLQNRRFLLVLDGFERQLRAYTSLNAPYQGDAVEEDERGDFRSCPNPNLARFLQDAAALSIQSRLLLTTRHFPREFDGLAGCESTALKDMHPAEALAFFHAHGIKGTRAEIRAACAPYGYHPLSLRLLAGVIVSDKKSPGDIQVAKRYPILPELKGKEQHHILEVSYNALNAPRRRLLSSIAAFRTPMAYDAISIFNPYKKRNTFDSALQELIDRGLLLRDTADNRYDLHPLVRRYAYDRLADKEGAHTRLRDYFATIPDPDQVESLDDLAPVIELYHHTVCAGQYDQACELLYARLRLRLYYRFGAYQTYIDILRALFPDGEDKPPRLEDEEAQSSTLSALANSYQLSCQPRRAEPLFARQNALQAKADHKANLAAGLGNVATTQLLLGKLAAAEQNLRRSIDLCSEIKNEFQEAVGHAELVRLLCYRGAFDEAALELDAAFEQFDKLGGTQSQSAVSAHRCIRALLMGEAGPALEAARRARGLAEETARNRYPVERDFVRAEWLIGAALVALATQDEAEREEHLVEAEPHLTDALARCRRINMMDHESDTLLTWARWHHLRGDPAQARKHANEALSIADRYECRLKQADCHNFLAALDRQEGDTNSAIEHARTAYERAWCDGPPHCYKPALDRATRLLNSLNADPPPLPKAGRSVGQERVSCPVRHPSWLLR